jgi:two-component system sensor histidine kinase PilS (NtrC family)
MLSAIKRPGFILPTAPPLTSAIEAAQWFFLARLAVLFAALAAIVANQTLRTDFPPRTAEIAFALVAVGFLITLLSSILLDKLGHGRVPSSVQMACDACLAGLWLRLVGAASGLAVLFYLVQILVAALTFFKRGAFTSALFSSLSYGLVAGAGPALFSFYSLLFFLVGFIGGYLAEELSRTNTELSQKEKTIARLTALQEHIVDNLPTGVLTIDKKLQIHFANPAASQILEVPRDRLVGKPLNDAFPDLMPFFTRVSEAQIVNDDESDRTSELEAAATGGEHKSFFVHSRNDNKRLQQRVEIGPGSTKRVLRGDVAELGAPIEGSGFLEAEATSGRILLFQDVTVVDHLEEKLRQNEKLAAVGKLAAGIAHEIRNPLASMSASIEMLRESLPGEFKNRENDKLMEIALREIQRLNELITEFLDYVKPSNIKLVDISVAPILEEVVSTAKARKDARSIEISVGTAPGIIARASPEKLRALLINLVLNSIQAIRGRGRVELGCRKEKNHVVIWVQDTGSGMTDEVKRHLFEPFFTTKEKGTGLGLATVYKIVEAHQGSIRCFSEPGKGSRFEVTLPEGRP